VSGWASPIHGVCRWGEVEAGPALQRSTTMPRLLAGTRRGIQVFVRWVLRWPRLVLVLLTLLCLLPFLNKAYHVDDPLFLKAAHQIIKHPLDPYGFSVVWYEYRLPMSIVTQNPPLACYYAALVGSIAGWREPAMHAGFLLPALGVVLGTYQLARRLTRNPLLAAVATLVAPGFLVSATSVMCDTMMLALWLLAMVCWMEGLEEPQKPLLLALSGVLIGICALTKYFGATLVPLLLVYSIVRRRRLGTWLAFLLIPVAVVTGYEMWTRALYGHGLFWFATFYTRGRHRLDAKGLSFFAHVLVGLGFAGGCVLPALTFAPALWSRRQLLAGGLVSAAAAFAFFRGWVNLGSAYLDGSWVANHWGWVSTQLLFWVAGGISVLALAIADCWTNRDATALLLLLWVAGTFWFAAVVNWTINARSILPMVPAVAILIARRLDRLDLPAWRWRTVAVLLPLILAGLVSLGVAAADEALANSARYAAVYLHQKTRHDPSAVEFQGHWGFQYYMELAGARPLEQGGTGSRPGDLIVKSVNNTNMFKLAEKTTVDSAYAIPMHDWVATISTDLGAGFYSSAWGPLPFAIGRVPNERYYVLRVEGPESGTNTVVR